MTYPDPISTGYNELAGSPRESLNESSGSSAERRFLVPMNSRLSFAEAISRTVYPHFPKAHVVSIDLQPWTEDLIVDGEVLDPSLTSADYGGQPCLVTVKYGPDFTLKSWPTSMPKPTFRLGTELRFQVRGSAKFLLIPSASCRWEDDATIPVPEDANTAVLISLKHIQIQWDFVDDPAINAFDSILGMVNNDTFLGCPAETLLIESYDVSETFRDSALHPHTNRVVVNFSQRKIPTTSGVYGWNHDYREYPAGWARLLLSDGKPRYKLTDFSRIFV